MPDGADAAVHHVARRHDVHTGPGLGQRLLHQHRHGFIIHDVAALGRVGVQQPVLAVAGEGVQRHVGHDAQLGVGVFQGPHHARHKAVRVQRFTPIRCFERRVNHREQRHHRNTQRHAVGGYRQQQVQAQALYAGHGAHRLPLLLAFHHKHWVDQVMRC